MLTSPILVKRLHRRANCRATNAETFHQDSFRRHFISRLQLTGSDHIFEPVKNFVG
jgi:hypothetical protein